MIQNNRNNSGSALMTVILVTFGFALILGPLLRSTVHEMNLNTRKNLSVEARNAAHSYAEYVRAELQKKYGSNLAISADQYPTDGSYTSPSLSDLTTMISNNGYSNVDVSSLGVKVYASSIGVPTVISSDDPKYKGTELSGKSGDASTINIYAMATATSGSKSVTSYIKQTLTIMDISMLQNAIFYNHEAELFPINNMIVSGGDTIVNGPLYLSPNRLMAFKDEVRVAGEVWFASKTKPNGSTDPKDWGIHYDPRLGDTTFGGTSFYIPVSEYSEAPDTWVSDTYRYYDGASNTFSMHDGYIIDARQPNWASLQETHYDFMLMGGVPATNPVGFNPGVMDDLSTPGDEHSNPGYSFIEPVLNETHDNYKTESVRNQKIAYHAGLILRVEGNPSYTPGSSLNEQWIVKGYKYQRDGLGLPVIVDGEPNLIPVNIEGGLIGDVNDTYDAIENPNDTFPEMYEEALYDDEVPVDDPDYNPEFAGENIAIGGFRELRQRFDEVNNDGTLDETNNRGIGVHTFTLDMAVLADRIEKNELTAATTGDGSFDTNTDWNGVIYFESPTSTIPNSVTGVYPKGLSSDDPIHPSRNDNVVKAKFPELVLQLINAEVLPQPASMTDPSFVLGTNAPLYTIGHFNADGSTDKDVSPTTPDINLGPDGNKDEIPAALVADTYTPLSSNWVNGRASTGMNDPMSQKSMNLRPAVDTEISAAIITGTTPTQLDSSGNKVGVGSAGIQNFHRKHEDWNTSSGLQVLAYRGSINSLFFSEAHPSTLYEFTDSGAPKRWWGFHDFFKAAGGGGSIPGIPSNRVDELTRYEEITATEFATGG